MIGRDNEAMIAHPNEHMCYEMAKLNERPFVTAGAVRNRFTPLCCDVVGPAAQLKGDEVYVSRIKSVGDISRFY